MIIIFYATPAADNDNDDADADPYSVVLPSKKSKSASKASAQRRASASAPQEFEGMVVDGALVLVCKHSRRAFASERDAAGELVCIGTWEAATKSVRALSPPAESSAPLENAAGDQAAHSSTSASSSTPSSAASPPAAEIITFPYAVDDADHCETGADAYADIEPLLCQVAAALNKTKDELLIYDPFYCQGAVKRHLATLGFTNVYNRMEDFYEVQRQKAGPDFDVLVTNPPYSAEHIEAILRFCVKANKPWFLLVPNYVYRKPYYEECLALRAGQAATPMYLTPGHRYAYQSPASLRHQLKSKELATSPFLSFWYLDLGAKLNAKVAKWWQRTQLQKVQFAPIEFPTLTTRLQQLPRKFMDAFDPNRKRMRKNQRDAAKKKKLAAAALQGAAQ